MRKALILKIVIGSKENFIQSCNLYINIFMKHSLVLTSFRIFRKQISLQMILYVNFRNMTILDKEILPQKFNSFREKAKNNIFVSGKEQIPDNRNSSKLPQHKATKLPSEFEPKSSRYLLLNCLTKKQKLTMELIKYTKRNSIQVL